MICLVDYYKSLQSTYAYVKQTKVKQFTLALHMKSDSKYVKYFFPPSFMYNHRDLVFIKDLVLDWILTSFLYFVYCRYIMNWVENFKKHHLSTMGVVEVLKYDVQCALQSKNRPKSELRMQSSWPNVVIESKQNYRKNKQNKNWWRKKTLTASEEYINWYEKNW